ncbi:MAG TPA: hypothetical protein VFB35_09485 [Gaiellaceae bacterium]|nr:hypothetical protein [Gaiellaceae bacterium]
MSALAEIAPRLWSWSARRNGLPPTMTSYVLQDEAGTTLIDPAVRGGEQLLTALDRVVQGRVRILVTTPFHVRGSETLWRRWRDRHEVAIYGHEYCASRLSDRSAFRALAGGETLEGGVRAHGIGRPRRAEIPFELESHRALAFGDSVIRVDGRLRGWPRVRDDEHLRAAYEERLLPTLEPLAQFGVERILVTHGEPVLREGAASLRAALADEPWRRPTSD